MKIYKLIIGIFATLICTFSYSNAIVIDTIPSQGNDDISVGGPTQINTDEGTIFEFIQIINKYLWFSIGLVFFVILIVGGFKLIASEGDAGKTAKINKMLLGSGIGLMIAILSYAAIRIIINLFQ